MFIKHIFIYSLSVGLPGIVNLLALMVFTRLLTPEDYGQYAIVVAGAFLANAVLFRWINLSLLRFLVANKDKKEMFLSTALFGFFVMVLLTGFATLVSLLFVHEQSVRILVVMGLLLVWLHAFFELSRELVRSELMPGLYGVIGFMKAVGSVAFGYLFVWLGFGAAGLLAGLLTGLLLAVCPVIKKEWLVAKAHLVNRTLIKQFLSYGTPLSITFALAFLVSSSDRFLLGWLLGAETTGLYSVGYDLAKHSLGIPMMIVNLAAFPIAVRDLEQKGQEAAKDQLLKNATMLFAVSIPSAVGLVILAPNIAEVFIGAEFKAAATQLIPWISFGALLAGIKAYYFDLSFQFGQKTVFQIWITMAAAAINIILNLVLIPPLGVIGAAYATVAAYATGLGMSWIMGRNVFSLPFPLKDTGKILMAVVGMSIVLVSLESLRGLVALMLQLSAGAAVCTLIILGFNVMNLRDSLIEKIGVKKMAKGPDNG